MHLSFIYTFFSHSRVGMAEVYIITQYTCVTLEKAFMNGMNERRRKKIPTQVGGSENNEIENFCTSDA